MYSPHSWVLETGDSIHKNFKVHCYLASYVSLTKFTLLFMQFIVYCMTISYCINYTNNLFHPVDQSASRDLHCIKLSDYFICLLGEQNGFYHSWSVSILKLCTHSTVFKLLFKSWARHLCQHRCGLFHRVNKFINNDIDNILCIVIIKHNTSPACGTLLLSIPHLTLKLKCNHVIKTKAHNQ